MSSQRIAIVGGGFTGLAAAYELVKQRPDLQITLVEKSQNLGGLAGGFAVCGTNLEKTYHYLFLTDSEILGLVHELGLDDRLIWGDSTIGVYLGGRVYPFTTPRDVLSFSPCSLSGRLRLGLALFYLQKTNDWRQFIRQEAYRWLEKKCGKSAMQTVWEPLLQGKFSNYSKQVSMAWLWARVHSRANSRAQGGEKLGYFRGGFAVVVNRLEQELRKAGARILLDTSVDGIDLGAEKRALRCGGENIPFDRCLFTGPSFVLAKLLSGSGVDNAYLQKLNSVNYLGAVCMVFVSDQSLSRQFWINVHEPGAPFLLAVQHTNLVSPELYQGRHVYYLGSYLPAGSPEFSEDKESLSARWFSYLQRIFPEFDRRRVQEYNVFRFNAAQHIVDTDYESRIPAYQTPVPGLFLANFSQIYPEDRGTNFAVREGKRAASVILRQ